jgi:hypothetical protein
MKYTCPFLTSIVVLVVLSVIWAEEEEGTEVRMAMVGPLRGLMVVGASVPTMW